MEDVPKLTSTGAKGAATAVAIDSKGKLITAYHNIDSYNTIKAINSKGKVFDVSVGKISPEYDLAYLYIDAENIPYAPLSKKVSLGEDLYLLSYEDLLLKGIASQIHESTILLNFEAKKGSSGGGVFNTKNELVAILSSKDYLDKTSRAIRVTMFDTITEVFSHKKELLNLDSNNYDNSYCYDEDDLKLWKRYAKSDDPKIQEYHALFLGLCQKVEDRDITTEEAQYIFERTRQRLFGEE